MKRIKLLALNLLFICSASAMAGVSATDPWIRGTVAAQKATGAFMTLKSPSATRLVSASVPAAIADLVEVHEMTQSDGVMKMRAIDGLDIPAHQPVALKPGSYHIMLMKLKRALTAGEKIPVTLKFVNAAKETETLTVEAEVRAMNQPNHGHHSH